jgi:hypothetical protein
MIMRMQEKGTEDPPTICPNCKVFEMYEIYRIEGNFIQVECEECEYRYTQLFPQPKNDGIVHYHPVSGGGWTYTLYGEDNRTTVYSRSYGTEKEAIQEAQKDLNRGIPQYSYGYIYPPSVEVQGALIEPKAK